MSKYVYHNTDSSLRYDELTGQSGVLLPDSATFDPQTMYISPMPETVRLWKIHRCIFLATVLMGPSPGLAGVACRRVKPTAIPEQQQQRPNAEDEKGQEENTTDYYGIYGHCH